MASFEGGAKCSEQVHISVINCAPPFTRQRIDLNVEIESAHSEKTEVAVDPLSSRGINKCPFRNVNMLAGTENLSEFFTRKRRACLVKAR